MNYLLMESSPEIFKKITKSIDFCGWIVEFPVQKFLSADVTGVSKTRLFMGMIKEGTAGQIKEGSCDTILEGWGSKRRQNHKDFAWGVLGN